MKYFEMKRERHAALTAADALVAKAESSKRELSAEEKELFNAHMAEVSRLNAQIKPIEENNSITRMFNGNAGLILDAGRTEPKAASGGEAAPDMGRFQAEFHDWVNQKLGNPWPNKITAADTPLFVGTGVGVESVGFAVPKTVLPYLSAWYNLDSFGLAGARIIETQDTVPMVFPVLSAGPAADTFAEGAAPTESKPFTGDSFTFGGTKYSRLVKASYEGLMNAALPLQGAIQDELLASLATTLTSAITTSMLAALAANSNVLVSEGTNDIYKTLGSLLHAIPPRFDAPNNKFMLSRATLAKIKDVRATTSGVPMFDPISNQIFGKATVINDNLNAGQVVYGDWQDGCIIRRTPVIVRVLYEKYSEQGEVGFRVMQWSDSHFLCELAADNQPLYYSVLA